MARQNISDIHANLTDGPNKFSFVRKVLERVVEQNNQLIEKLELLK